VAFVALNMKCDTALFVAGKSCDLWHLVSKRTKMARNFGATVARKRRSGVLLVKRVSHTVNLIE